jgi:hypothetical protein
MRNDSISVFIKIDPEQFDILNRKLDHLLALALTPGDPARLAAVTAELKKSADALNSAVAANQPQP